MNKKYNELQNQLNIILAQDDIRSNKELSDLLILSKKELEKGDEYNLICKKLTKNIDFYLISHNFKAPASILNLHNKIKNGDLKYKSSIGYISNITSIFKH